ncbi:unnamed protein product [Larinioides sclopetarius]|uniref:Uncharacterized protein n=1 Tax=Larinioides sclopetarius TaxID=280406 RepID=A0AAV2BX44_9ARAC
MSRKIRIEILLFYLLPVVLLCYAEDPNSCSPLSFLCLKGKRLDSGYACNGNMYRGENCGEKYCTTSQCKPHYFACNNGKCVYYTKVCDKKDDCGDHSDEDFCNPNNCNPLSFLCLNGRCLDKTYFCNGQNYCGDNSDERYCHIHFSDPCPPGWYRCPNGKRCIPFLWMCNGRQECLDISEEDNCDDNNMIKPNCITGNYSTQNAPKSPNNTVLKSSIHTDPEAVMKSRFLRSQNPVSKPDRWRSQVHRIAVALHLADESTFGPGNNTGEEIRYELTMQLHRIGKQKRISSQKLALYIHALLVACLDPRDFYGDDLVGELRRRVEAGGNYTNPFLILVLCNAGDTMTARDVDRVTDAYDTQYRPFWADYEALSSMALSCISSSSSVSMDESILNEMLQELKKHQFKNGNIDNFKTTALVTQALFIHDSYKTDYDLDSTIKFLTDRLSGSNSLLDFYYALPVLNRKSLLNVTSGHCKKESDTKEEALEKELSVDRETITVFFSVLMGEESNGDRLWRLKMLVKSTIYDAIETWAQINSRKKVEYNVVDGKPYVSALNGKEDDPEMGMFWFIYRKTFNSDKDPKIVKGSPVDIILQPNQEIILWYKRDPWSGQSPTKKSDPPTFPLQN